MQARLLNSEDVPAGELILWFPSKESQRATFSAPLDNRPLTADQLVHFDDPAAVDLDAEPSDLNPAPWIGLSCFLADATAESVARTIGRYFDRHEIMRNVFDTDDFGSITRSLIPAGLARFEPVTVGVHDSQENHRRLARHLAREARCTDWPYAGFATIHHEGGATLFAAFDHMVFDGYSLYISLDEFPRTHANVLAGEAAAAPAPSHADYALLEHTQLNQLTSNSPEVAAWRNALNEDQRLPGLPSQTGVQPSEQWPHEFVSLPLLSAQETVEVKNALHARGASSGLGFMAGVLTAALSFEPSHEISFLVSTHNRPSAAWGSSVGWFAGVVPIALHLGNDVSLDATYQALSSEWETNKNAGIVRMPEVSRLLNAQIEPSLVLSYMENKHAPGSDRWKEYHAKTLLGPTPSGAQIHLWINCMPEGTFLEVRYPTKPSCLRWIQDIATQSRAVFLAALENHAATTEDSQGLIPCK